MSNKFILRIDASKSSLSLALRLQKGKFYKKPPKAVEKSEFYTELIWLKQKCVQ